MAAGTPPLNVYFHLARGDVGQHGRMDREIQDRNLATSEDMVALTTGFDTKRFLSTDSQTEYDVTLERVQRGEIPGMATDERTPCCPTSEYGRAKLAFSARGGKMTTRLDTDYCHLRIFSVCGPGDHEASLVASAVRAAWAGGTATFSLYAQQWDFPVLADTVQAFRSLGEAEVLRTDDNPVFSVDSFNTEEPWRFVEETFETAGRSASPAHFMPREIRPEGIPYLASDIARSLRDIDWTPEISSRAGVRESLSDIISGGN